MTMRPFKQSDPRATFRRVYFTCVDTNSLLTRLQSSDMSTFVVYLTKNGATPTDISARTPVQVDATNQKGLFYVPLTAADLDTPGKAVLVITNTGGTKTMEKRELEIDIDIAFFATAATGTLTTSAFTSDRSEASGAWNGELVKWVTGSLTGQTRKIGTFLNSGGLFTLATGLTFSAPPANGDIAEIITQ
jgi:hypothetical protein